jgi:prepilin-type N-terminal cleavage/methylation domain-containing protein
MINYPILLPPSLRSQHQNKVKTIPQTSKKGMTLLELTVVILVLLALIAILFVGGRAWKKGSDRAASTLQIRNVQQAVRSYANMHPEKASENVVDPTEIWGSGKFIETTQTVFFGDNFHPAGSGYKYVFAEGTGTKLPPLGSLYIKTGGTPPTGGEATTYYDPDSTKISDW